MKLLSQIAFLLLFTFSLMSCQGCGNKSSKKTVPDESLKLIVGSVHNTAASDMQISVVEVSTNGQLKTVAPEEGSVATFQYKLASSLATDASVDHSGGDGRFSMALAVADSVPVVVFADALLPSNPPSSKDFKGKLQCQLAVGCALPNSTVLFGEYYDFFDVDDLEGNNLQSWRVALEYLEKGQFISITPFTELATALGFTVYLPELDNPNTPADDGVSAVNKEGTEAAPAYYSRYGIVSSNSQVADLLGLTDIASMEPANLFKLDKIIAESSSDLKLSIRYGALNAALQSLELAFNKNRTAGSKDFWRLLVKDFLNNKGQIYQKDAPDISVSVMTKSQLLQAAIDNLQQVKSYYSNRSQAVPIELDAVVNDFKGELAVLVVGQLTQATPQVSAKLAADYASAIEYTKAVVDHLADFQNTVATGEYRQAITGYSDYLNTQGKRLTPEFNQVMIHMRELADYFSYCLDGAVDVSSGHCANVPAGNYWLSHDVTFVAATNVLTAKGAGNDLVMSQRIVDQDTTDDIVPDKSIEIDLLLSGVFREGGLQLKLEDFVSDTDADKKTLSSGMRLTYASDRSRVEKNTVLEPLTYEFVFPVFTLTDEVNIGTDQEINLEGSFSVVLSQVSDSTGSNSELRYNLDTLSVVITSSSQSYGTYAVEGEELEYRDRIILTAQGSASEARTYYPDSKFPTSKNFFVPREGRASGEGVRDLVKISKGVETLPNIDEKGEKNIEDPVTVEFLDYELIDSGLNRFRVYPIKTVDGKKQFIAVACSVNEDNKALLYDAGAARNSDGEVVYQAPNPKAGEDGEPATIEATVLSCLAIGKYDTNFTLATTDPDGFSVDAGGVRLIDDFMRKIWALNQLLFTAVNNVTDGVYSMTKIPEGLPGHTSSDNVNFTTGYNQANGVLRIDPDNAGVEILDKFPNVNKANEAVFQGIMLYPRVLGINTLRMNVVNPTFVTKDLQNNGTGFLPKSAIDLMLVHKSKSQIEVQAFFAFKTDYILRSQDDNQFPIVAIGDDVESYHLAYGSDISGQEFSDVVINWGGVKLENGALSHDVELDSFIFNLSSRVTYSDALPATSPLPRYGEKCGLLQSGQDIADTLNCTSVAYLTFRGLVVGVVREERPGVLVIRYIDGSWQIIGG